MQRVWNFPMGTKQGCPQDRESSGHVGIHVKKCTRNFLVCKQTLLPRGVCAHMHICINKFSFCYVLQDLGEWEGWKNQRKGNYCLHSGGTFPCFSHQHWPEPTVDSAATCDDGEGRNGNCTSAYPILPFVKFLGQQKCFNGPNPLHLPKASALVNPDIFPAAQLGSRSVPN